VAIRTSDCPRHVYVATDDKGWHKVGTTANLGLRRYHLERDRGTPVRMVHFEPMQPQAELIEISAHWLLAGHENSREWFRVDAETAIGAVRQAAQDVAGGHVPHTRFSGDRRKAIDAEQDAAINKALRHGESFAQFLRVAVERELERRERK